MKITVNAKEFGLKDKIEDLQTKSIQDAIDYCFEKGGGVVEIPEGKILSIVVPAPSRFPQFGHRDDFLIPWECIKKIGPDIILVDIKPDQCRIPRPKLGFLC